MVGRRDLVAQCLDDSDYELPDDDALYGPPPPLAPTDSEPETGPGFDEEDEDSDEDCLPLRSLLGDAAQSWTAVDHVMKLDAKPRAPHPARSPQSVAVSGTFTPTKAFAGAKNGYVFTTRNGQTGYYKDDLGPSVKTQINLCELIAPPGGHEYDVHIKKPPRHARDALGKRVRRRKHGLRRTGTTAISELEFLRHGHTFIEDASWRDAALWALDTVSGNSWTTTESSILPRSTADVMFVQETKRAGDEALQTLRNQGRDKAWNFIASSALRTAADKASGGCAVGVRRGNGVTESDASYNHAIDHRFVLGWTAAVRRGGLHCGSVYLKDAAGLCEHNLLVLQEIAVALRQLRGPWVLGGDWNLTPDVLQSSGWLDVVHGVVVAPTAPTCFSATYDYFVVAEELVPFIAGCVRIDDAGLYPHWPARLLLRGDARRLAVRKLRQPPQGPRLLAFWPLALPREPRRRQACQH